VPLIFFIPFRKDELFVVECGQVIELRLGAEVVCLDIAEGLLLDRDLLLQVGVDQPA
jgi:hypothetical protein